MIRHGRSGALKDFTLELSRGNIPGMTNTRIQGRNPTTGTAFEVIQGTADTTYPWPIVADSVDIVSDDTDDTSAGTGARTVLVTGLDINHAVVTEALTMNGTSTVAGSVSFYRINNMLVTTVGTIGGANEGSLTLTHDTSGDKLSIILPGSAISQMGVYTVPASKKAYLARALFETDATKTLDVRVRVRLNGDDVSVPVNAFVEVGHLDGLQENLILTFPYHLAELAAKADMQMEAKVSASTSSVTGATDWIIVDD